MDKYKRYFGVLVFCAGLALLLYTPYALIVPNAEKYNTADESGKALQAEVQDLQERLERVQKRIKDIQSSILTSQKKVYYPLESDLGNETLFFTMYNDVIEILRSNSVKIKSISYVYNPEADSFVTLGKGGYFVCDINMELIASYVNIGNLLQDIYQYPYYIRMNDIEVKSYSKDKKVLMANLSLRLYSHIAPASDAGGGG